jgi:hypothetical protein
MVESMWSQRRAVSSMRVPVRARTWILNWPASTEGKKSCPREGRRRPTEAREKTVKRTRKMAAWSTQTVSRRT